LHSTVTYEIGEVLTTHLIITFFDYSFNKTNIGPTAIYLSKFAHNHFGVEFEVHM